VAQGAMRRFLLVLLFVFGWASAAAAAPQDFLREFNDSEKSDFDRISAYLNAIHTLKGSFVQIDPDGQIDEGVLYIEKPGRMRFEYHAPNPVLIVSDGATIAVQNRKLNTIDQIPVWSTPLSLLLSDDLNLKRNPAIAGVTREPGEIIVRARWNSNKISGNITLVFTDPTLELRQWTVVDGQGLSTTVSLRDIQQGVPLDPALFTLPQKKDFTKKDE
jgi:outer membrane lipoprotein-sorting protein